LKRTLKLQSQHLLFPLAGSLGDSFGVVEGDGAGDELLWVGNADVAGGPLGSGVESSDDSSDPATETSPSPSNCGISAIADMSLVGSLGGWRWRLRFAGGAGGDGLVVVSAPMPAGPAAFFLAAARVSRAAATAALVVVAADAFGAAAAGAAVAADADAATAA
jgi:hypothetical protein